MITSHPGRTYWRHGACLAVAFLGLSATALGQNPDSLKIAARDPAGHGIRCQYGEKTIVMVSGSPEQMGTAHGVLLADSVRKMSGCILRIASSATGGDIAKAKAQYDGQMAEIAKRTSQYIPPRFIAECDALSKAAGIPQEEGRYNNLLPELFHCSGIALRGKATVGGKVLHARVLDYTCEAGLQDMACVMVFLPEGRNAWMNLGYTGFIGTVTAMNEKGLAIGEMGGGGEGQWDGVPMSLLLRDIMERASTVDEALDIFRKSPRTCKYYYVVSDKTGAMRALCCSDKDMTVLEPGQQYPMFPRVPDDSVYISEDERAVALSQRLHEHYGKIDVPRLIEILKRPVAMNSNLHDAIFAPETLDMWFADAGKDKNAVACDQPYAHVNLRQLIAFFQSAAKP